ncbi:MAG: FAD-binding oxidoreductase [Verrucomicrobiota bacterium]
MNSTTTLTRPTTLNDVHARLNPTRVNRLERPTSVRDIQRLIRKARTNGQTLSISGGRHAMGGQQFGTDALHIDMRSMNRILDLDRERGEIEVETGIEWPALMLGAQKLQQGSDRKWGIRQKQTGADRLSIGGAIASNIHGRGLEMKPFIDDLVSFKLLDADGGLKTCSRTENPDLFRLVVGGYGLFGIVVSARLRLAPRVKVRRIVKPIALDDLMAGFEASIAAGATYGDFQFSIDPNSDEFLRHGIFSCYHPVETNEPVVKEVRRLTKVDWQRLIYLAHTDKAQAFEAYRSFYLSTSGQLYWSDTHQLSLYLDDYHEELDRKLGATCPGSEMITELYVPRDKLTDFMEDVRSDFLRHNIDLIYGTIRLIQKDDESILAWAKQDYACVIFNLHTDHCPSGIEISRQAFQRLIDIALVHNGSYFLTYHRYARKDQVLQAYPQFPAFLETKLQHDPEERFQSNWYRHYRKMFQAAQRSSS